MPVALIRSAWSGTSGGPGVTQLFCRTGPEFGAITVEQATAATNAVRTFWTSMAPFLPNEIVISVSPVVDEYDVSSGSLIDSTVATSGTQAVQGTSAAIYSMASGVKINMQTGFVRNGRRVRGGIFLVPAGSNVYSDVGLIAGAARTTIGTAANKLIADFKTGNLELGVYSRPIAAGEKYGPRLGAFAPYTASEVSEKVAILRGRRD